MGISENLLIWRGMTHLRSDDMPNQSIRKSYSSFSSFSTYTPSSPSDQQRHQYHIDVAKMTNSHLHPHFLHVDTIICTVANAREALRTGSKLCRSCWSVCHIDSSPHQGAVGAAYMTGIVTPSRTQISTTRGSCLSTPFHDWLCPCTLRTWMSVLQSVGG